MPVPNPNGFWDITGGSSFKSTRLEVSDGYEARLQRGYEKQKLSEKVRKTPKTGRVMNFLKVDYFKSIYLFVSVFDHSESS